MAVKDELISKCSILDTQVLDYWIHFLSTLLVYDEELNHCRQEILAWTEYLRDEYIAVEPFTTYPKLFTSPRDCQFLMDFGGITRKILVERVLKEKLSRLRLIHEGILATQKKSPFIL